MDPLTSKPNEVSLETVQALYELLVAGELPDEVKMEALPVFTPRQAFALIWYLQEISRVLPDHFEQCHWCEEVFDTQDGLYIIGDGTPLSDPLYEDLGVTAEELKEHDGKIFCSTECEASFWMAEHAQP